MVINRKDDFSPIVGERKIAPDHPCLQYMGRIDFDKEGGPELVFPCSYVRLCFTGTSVRVALTNTRSCWDNYFGVLIDGVQRKFRLPENGAASFVLARGLEDTKHELVLFKRMDSCHTMQFHGFFLEHSAAVHTPPPLPRRRMEVYGDSVSAGEVSEAVYYEGQPDPPHNGEFSNSYFSYAWMTARKCNAQLHDIAQGGISLLDKTGWFGGPDYKGIWNIYDKIEYHPDLGVPKPWDFRNYTPQVVIVAIGQNDSHPVDEMALAYDGEKAAFWRRSYREFVRTLRGHYPAAHIVLKTTILEHHPSWDKAIGEVRHGLADEKIHHFRYRNNGTGTKGHIRIQEAEGMAAELTAYILPFFGE
ncbi:MAG: GDSL-type esterase/lipase family protein [Clostridium sp.]|jgi:hypothetical protein|nr:GDSL-type esterase/lipase family protein [Clostridium sp.]